MTVYKEDLLQNKATGLLVNCKISFNINTLTIIIHAYQLTNQVVRQDAGAGAVAVAPSGL